MVAELLGVSEDELAFDVSLPDDLAADSLDLLEMALMLESQLGIVVPERSLDAIRTYGELVDVVVAALGVEPPNGAVTDGQPVPMRARVTAAGGNDHGGLVRAGRLTPYTAELIAEDAVQAGPGARLQIALPGAGEAALAAVRTRFAGLAARGVEVAVRG